MFHMRLLALKYIKLASEVHLKVVENLAKARKSDLLLYEFPSRGEILSFFVGALINGF